ncbi:MAG TPA: neutral zinc metallopeptidase, partial [Steroidobacteraceae bacterium]|nr:neutral zinc metallopeptidase [Steroidobacteraceae bacterium]
GFGGGGFGGGGIPIPIGGGGGGLFKGGIGLVAFIVIALIFGVDPMALLSGLAGGDTASYTAPTSQSSRTARAPAADAETHFVSRVLKSTEDVWTSLFSDMGRRYVDPKLVLYRDATRTACGTGQSAMGPFYCPADERVYLDLGFFDDLASRFHAPGQFPQAYVIAHEVGHHVQNQLGITAKVDQMRQSMSKRDANALSVRVELQADCFAGVWAARANAARKILEPGDLEQGLNAASSVGDDTLQKREQGTVVPDSFTHGTSAQRVAWFRRGFDSGNIDNCDTFSAGATPAPP